MRLCDPSSDAVSPPRTSHIAAVTSLSFGTTKDGRFLLASASKDKTVRLWDPITATCLATVLRRCEIHSVAWADPVLAIGDAEGVSVIELCG